MKRRSTTHLALSGLCCLALAATAAAVYREPLRMSIVRMRMQMDAEERAMNLPFDAKGGRVLKCKRQSGTTALCGAGYWGYTEVPGADGSKSYRHRDCTERVRFLSEPEDYGGFFPVLTVLERPRCVAYESAHSSSSLWSVLDYARAYAAELAGSLPYDETAWKVSNCWRPSSVAGECDIEYSGSTTSAPNGISSRECAANVKVRFVPSGRSKSASVGERTCH
jgi:hypothetical protein